MIGGRTWSPPGSIVLKTHVCLSQTHAHHTLIWGVARGGRGSYLHFVAFFSCPELRLCPRRNFSLQPQDTWEALGGDDVELWCLGTCHTHFVAAATTADPA